MTIEGFAVLAVLAALFIGWRLAKLAWRVTRRVGRQVGNRLIDRAVDAVLFVLLFKWLKNRDRQPERAPVLHGDQVYAACDLSGWEGGPNNCRWCDNPLPDRAKRWCGAECRIAARNNHEFGYARDAALERDEHTCVRPRCGAVATFDRALEVNHIELARGRHNQASCIHHLDNLETLCGRHHDEVTAGQRARGWAS